MHAVFVLFMMHISVQSDAVAAQQIDRWSWGGGGGRRSRLERGVT